MEWVGALAIEEHSLLRSLQDNIPVQGSVAAGAFASNERWATFRIHKFENWVSILFTISGEIHSRHESLQQPAHEDGHGQVRSLNRSSRAKDRTGLDRPEGEVTLVVCGNAAIALESGLDGLGLLVVGMVVLSVRVRLPDFNDSIGHRSAIAIQNSSLKHHSLACDLGARHIDAIETVEADPKEWPDSLRTGRLKAQA
jgi:hypothetical protein